MGQYGITPGQREGIRNTALDAVALLLSANRQDVAALNALTDTYHDRAEVLQLLQSVLAFALASMQTASLFTGIPVETALGNAAQEIRGDSQ